MTDCDANYLRLLKLFPDIASDEQRRIGLRHGVEGVLQLDVLEQTPYTTLIKLSQISVDVSANLWITLPVLKLRLYHDAQAAEVVSCEGERRAYPRYEYPNKRMYHQDEKAQWNQFLAEWLAHCLKHGYEIIERTL